MFKIHPLEFFRSTMTESTLTENAAFDFPWSEEPTDSTFSNVVERIITPNAPFSIKNTDGDWQEFFGLVDSGAVITMLNASDCEVLGLELTAGEPARLMSASRTPIPVYIHEVELKIGNDIITAKVAFAILDLGRRYLGRIDLFDAFEITFQARTKNTKFVRET